VLGKKKTIAMARGEKNSIIILLFGLKSRARGLYQFIYHETEDFLWRVFELCNDIKTQKNRHYI
jgi:hypothetical protein